MKPRCGVWACSADGLDQESGRLADQLKSKERKLTQMRERVEEAEAECARLTSQNDQKSAKISELETLLADSLERERKLNIPLYSMSKDQDNAAKRYGVSG